MRIKYSHARLFIGGGAFLLALIGFSAYVFVTEGDYGLGALCALVAAVVLVALFFRFNYGIKIGRRLVLVIANDFVRLFKYSSIDRIEVCFYQELITAKIRTADRKRYEVVWDDIYLGYSFILPQEAKIKITEKYVEKAVARLSRWEKVTAKSLLPRKERRNVDNKNGNPR